MAETATKAYTFALLGNPNSGKSSVFNYLTGLRQKVGNFPGVTVDKKAGYLLLPNQQRVTLLDLPGCYSLHPASLDERVVAQTLCQPDNPDYPDALVYVADSTQLEKHLLLFSQLRDLGLPILLLLNMSDLAEAQTLQIDTGALARYFDTPVLKVSGRTGEGLELIPEALQALMLAPARDAAPKYRLSDTEQQAAALVQAQAPALSAYQALQLAHQSAWISLPDSMERSQLQASLKELGFESLRCQVRETMARFDEFGPEIKKLLKDPKSVPAFSGQLDRLLTHPVAGPLIFLLLMTLVFQAIFAWANYPMDWIEAGFGALSGLAESWLPAGWLADLVSNGILAGLGGILVFIPQIAILFFLINLLEEVGYMARAAFLFDGLMQRFGLNGRSVVALISGGACAIPAIMSTRTISDWKERLITILVTPFISCSARIPVYVVLVGFVAPPETVLGVFNAQGLVFMGLYLLGIIAAFVSAYVLKLVLRSEGGGSFLLLELPEYRWPMMRNVLLSVYEKVRTFVWEAGRIILAISIVLWFLASYGPSEAMEAAGERAATEAAAQQLSELEAEDLEASYRIEASYAGHLGKFIEPVIRPLGFDWKIGIALITSFAAREVFVGTMATIYSIGSVEDEFSIRDRLAKERDPVSGAPVYTLATSLSLLIFYVFAMQCMSTLAVVRRETKSWKWPMVQFVFMTGVAYLGSWLTYFLLG